MTRRGLLLFAVMSVIWGIPYLFIRVVVAEVSPSFLVLARTLIAAAILLPIALARVDIRPILARWRWLTAFAAIEIAIPWVMLGSAEQHLSSSLTGLLIAGVPLVGTVFALTTGGPDRIGRVGWIGLLIGLIGVAAIGGADRRDRAGSGDRHHVHQSGCRGGPRRGRPQGIADDPDPRGLWPRPGRLRVGDQAARRGARVERAGRRGVTIAR